MNELARTLPIEELEREMLKLPQASCGVRHHFAAGCYIREVTLPADTYAVGHRHKTWHVNILKKGIVVMVNPDGSTTEMRAPLMFIGRAGRKVGYIKEETVWLNIWPTDETDVAKLEGQLFEKSAAFEEATARLLEHREQDKLIGYDREDYRDFLAELGKSEKSLKATIDRDDDLIPFPAGSYKVKVGDSNIHRLGLIATDDIKAGEIICAARIGEQRTPAGRFTNHSRDPNARMLKQAQVVMLVATRDIQGARGGFDGEEVTVNYRQAIAEVSQQ